MTGLFPVSNVSQDPVLYAHSTAQGYRDTGVLSCLDERINIGMKK